MQYKDIAVGDVLAPHAWMVAEDGGKMYYVVTATDPVGHHKRSPKMIAIHVTAVGIRDGEIVEQKRIYTDPWRSTEDKPRILNKGSHDTFRDLPESEFDMGVKIPKPPKAIAAFVADLLSPVPAGEPVGSPADEAVKVAEV